MSPERGVEEFDLLRAELAPGLNLIEAGAGTGKTWTLAHLVPRLIISGAVERLDQVLLVSFTEDATRELAGRVRAALAGLVRALVERHPRPDTAPDLEGLLRGAEAACAGAGDAGGAVLARALAEVGAAERPGRVRALLAARLDADRLVVSTIHALCRRILADEAFLCGAPSGFGLEAHTRLRRDAALRDVWRRDLVRDPVLAAAALARNWSLKSDALAMRLLEPIDGEALRPEALDLSGARGALVRALEALRAESEGLDLLGDLDRDQTLQWAKGRDPDLEGLRADIHGLRPDAPAVRALARVEGLAMAPDWLKKPPRANREARARLEAAPFVAAARRARAALKDLDWAWTGHVLTAGRRRVELDLRRANQMSFNGLVAGLERALRGPNGEELALRLRRRWRVALVDESQDTDRRQLAIFEAVFNRPGELETSLALIGDPKQSIYGFRGADLAAYEALRERPGTLRRRLTRTHRSAEGLVRCLNRIFGSPQALLSPGLEVPPASAAKSDADLPLPPGRDRRLVAALVEGSDLDAWKRAPDRRRLAARAAAAAVAALLDRAAAGDSPAAGPVPGPGNCAVLVSDRHQARAVRDALAECGLRAVVRDNSDVMESDAARDLAAVLRAMLRPADRGAGRAALATRLLGLDAAGLDRLDALEEGSWTRRLAGWGRIWERQGIAPALSGMDRDAGMSGRLAGLPQGDRLLTDLRHLEELLAAEEAERRLAPGALARWFEAGLARARTEAEATDRDPGPRLRRLESDAAAVQVLTVHRSKGLEFDHCFLPFLWSARPPQAGDLRVAGFPGGERALCDPGRLPEADRGAFELDQAIGSLEEELRQAYVALTRARVSVWLLGGGIGYGGGRSALAPSALDWLLRVPRAGEGARDWYRRLEAQKKAGEDGPGACEHRPRLEALAAAEPLLGLEAVRLPGPAPRPVGAADDGLDCEAAPHLPLPWGITSFTALAGDHAPERESAVAPGPEHPVPPALEGRLPLAELPSGTRMGSCLHALLEAWDFQDLPAAALQAALEEHGFETGSADGRALLDLLAKELPRWGAALVPGLGPLADCAADPGLSEWQFLLPLAPRGVDGRALAEVFAGHPDPRLRDYARDLEVLAPERLHGFAQGFMDRLARGAGRWAVLDWKSNRLGDRPQDYHPDRLFEEARRRHYILQMHLYLVALRRHLRRHAPGQVLDHAGLVFVRALEPGTERGMLRFGADAAFLDRLEGLFEGGGA